MHLFNQVIARAGGPGYQLITNRFYTSFPLALQLRQNQSNFIGKVLTTSKNLSTNVKRLRLRKHELKVNRHPDKLLKLAWQDKSQILMLSTWQNRDTARRQL